MKMPDPTESIEAFGGFYHPVERLIPGGGTYSSGGITLRDWFAGQALQGMMATASNPAVYASVTAANAYLYADAMLEARK